MSARSSVASDLASITDETDDVLVRVLLTTGHTVEGTGFYVRSDGLIQMQRATGDGLAVIIDPAHVIASYVPDNAEDSTPWV